MLEELNLEESRTAVCEALSAIGTYQSLDAQTLLQLVDAALEIDIQYMKSAGVEEGEAYDEEIAYDKLVNGLKQRFPKRKSMLSEFADDYLEAMEAYLDSIGALVWDD